MSSMNIQLRDKAFKVLYTRQQIIQATRRVAKEIAERLEDKINTDLMAQGLLVLAIANGGMFFAVDLAREFDRIGVLQNLELDATRLHSYEGTGSTGTVKTLYPPKTSVAGRVVLVAEDIVDSGRTMVAIIDQLRAAGAAEIYTAAMLCKPDACLVPGGVQLDFCAFPNAPNEFLVGGGLDYDGQGRGLRHIYVKSGDLKFTTEDGRMIL